MMKKKIGTSLILFFIMVSTEASSIDFKNNTFIYEMPQRYKRVYAPFIYQDFVLEVADVVGVDPDLLCAVIKVESNWVTFAIGNNGNSVDRGLGQINSKYESWYTEKFGIEDYRWDDGKKNILLTAKILKWSGVGFSCITHGVAAYNCGRSRVVKNTIPESTKKYVEKVMAYYNYYKNHK
jgi:soluble lytic murein transglycosylase-like protein